MNATIESLFGLSSDVIDIPAFVRAAAEIDRATYNRETALHTPECSVDDLRTSLFDSWNSPSLSAYLSKDHDHVITSLYSTTKSAKPKRKTALLDPDSLPPDVAAFQNNLDAVKLTSWKLKIDSATFIRVSKNSDQNVLAQVKPSPEPSGHLSDTDPQAVITVTIHTRSTWTPGYINRSSQHALLSNQTLGDLFQVIPCTSNEIVNKYAFTGTSNFENRRPKGEDGCVICIENLAYGDGFGQGDYAQKLVEHLQTLSKDPPAITKAPTSIYETPLASLLLRVNQPYWLLHQGNCEHFLVVDQIRLQHAADVRSGYPLTLQITPPLLDLCRACVKVPAGVSIIGDLRLGESPCLLCASCWRHMGDPPEPDCIIVQQLPKFELGWQ